MVFAFIAYYLILFSRVKLDLDIVRKARLLDEVSFDLVHSPAG